MTTETYQRTQEQQQRKHYNAGTSKALTLDSPHRSKGITPEHITGCVCRYFNVQPDKLSTPSHKAELCRSRFFIWHFIFLYCPMPLWMAANLFQRDHASVLHGVRTLRWESDHVRSMGEMMRELERKIIREWDQMP